MRALAPHSRTAGPPTPIVHPLTSSIATMADFPTTILTSKSPEDVANFLPRSLKLSQTLIEQNLVAWFSNYMNMIMRYNHDLNSLVANGRHFFTAAEGEFGAIDKIWNCVASCVMSQIHVNDSLLRTIKNDIVIPFNSAFNDDFKYSELLVNSQELLQMLGDMETAEGAYNWNVKAPAILQNFENYKRYEKDLLFNAFIAYLNVVNSKNASLLSKNENAVNFILKEFNIDKEMENYTDYMVNTKVEAPPQPAPKREVEKIQKSKTTASSAASTTSAASGSKDRRKSKLMLKVGSILGRKKRNNKNSHSETIPEDHSVVSTTLSRLETYGSRAETKNSLYQPPAPIEKQRHKSTAASFGAKDSSSGPAPVPVSVTTKSAPLENTHSAANDAVMSPSTNQASSSHGVTSISAKPLIPASVEAAPVAASTVEPSRENDMYVQDEGVPNVERYGSSDDESDVPTDKNGNRLSLLKTHDLGNTPKLNSEAEPPARASSAGKYSFEYGDEEKSISTPTQTPKIASSGFESETAPPVYDESNAQKLNPEKAAFNDVKTSARSAPPPPPPSRKQHAPAVEQKKDMPSSINTSFSHAADGMSLRSQMTGNTMLKQDYFKHFDAAADISRPGLNTSVAEIINVTILRGEVTKSQILGEVAFNYNSQEALDSVTVKIPSKFTRSLLNEQLMQEQSKGIYALNVGIILGKTLGGIKYSLDIKPHEVPILVKQIWKTEPTQASLIVKVMLNPAYAQELQLNNFVVSASLESSVTSTAASSKPEGSFNKDANRITWRYNKPLHLSANNPEEKLIARIMTNGEAKEAASGVRIKFSVDLPTKSFAQILDVDDQPVSSVINLSSGNYSSHFE